MILPSCANNVTHELRWQVENILRPIWNKFNLNPPDELQLETLVAKNLTICRMLWNDLQKYIEVELDILKYPNLIIIDEEFIKKVASLKGCLLEANQIKDCMFLLQNS